MSEGIKSLGNEEQDVQDANLGLTGDISSGQNKGDLGNNLFLSTPEQRGLEAATFGSVLGQAPATGSFFGDIFSTLAQTAPAAVATFKERQSIKEKEAEYKEKKQSLAGKLNMTHVVDTTADDLGVSLLPENYVAEQNQLFPGKYFFVQSGNLTSNPVPNAVYASGPNAGESAVVGAVEMRIDQLKSERDENYTRKYGIDNSEFGEIFNAAAGDDVDLVDRVQKVDLNKWRKLPKNHPQKKGFIEGVPKRFEMQMEQLEKEITQQSNKQLKVNERLAGAQGLLYIREQTARAFQKGGQAGQIGSLTLGTNEIANFLGKGMSIIRGKVLDREGKLNNEEVFLREKSDLREAEGKIANYLIRKKESGKKLSDNEKELYRFFTSSLTDRETLMAETQAIATNVTQFVYLLAKSRESGGKFSVPDIEFAMNSVGANSNSAVRILTGMTKLINQNVDSVVRDARDSYFDPVNPNKVVTHRTLYTNPRLRPYQDIFRYYNDTFSDSPYNSLDQEGKDFWDTNYLHGLYKKSDVNLPKNKNVNIKDNSNREDFIFNSGQKIEEKKVVPNNTSKMGTTKQ